MTTLEFINSPFTITSHKNAYDVEWSSDGSMLGAILDDQLIVWTAAGENEQVFNSAALLMSWHPVRPTIAVHDNDGWLTEWNPAANSKRRICHISEIRGAAWAPDGSRVATI